MLNWSSGGFEGDESYINNNNLCPPYPDCIQGNIGSQNTLECIEYVLGDINFDGNINIFDILLLVDMILNYQYYTFIDINLDESIDIIDILLVIDIILINQ